METSLFFALFIGVIAVVHFLTLIAEQLRPTKRKTNVHTKRKDWYCFFSPSVLLGKDDTEEPVIQDTQSQTLRKRQQRRQQEQRRLSLKV